MPFDSRPDDPPRNRIESLFSSILGALGVLGGKKIYG